MIVEALTAGSLTQSLPPTGVSIDALYVQDRYDECRRAISNSVALAGNQMESLEKLDEAFTEASEPNWDGYGGVPVSLATYEATRTFVCALPPEVPSPDLTPEPDGEISLSWECGNRKVYSISVGPDNRLAYAGIDGSQEWFGAATFFDRIPQRLLSEIRGVFGW